MNKALKKTRILGILFILIFVGASWYFLLSPRLAEPVALQQTAEEALTQKLALETQIATLERREFYLDEAEVAAQQLESRFPWQPDVPTLIQQVQEAGTRAGMTLEQIISVVPGKPTSEGVTVPGGGGGAAPAPAPEGGEGGEGGEEPAPAASAPAASAEPAMARMDVNISVVGTYEQIAEFLAQLRTSNRVIIVNQLQLTVAAAPDGSLQNQYQANIKAYAVLLPKPPQPPKPQGDAASPNAEASQEASEEENAATPAAG